MRGTRGTLKKAAINLLTTYVDPKDRDNIEELLLD